MELWYVRIIFKIMIQEIALCTPHPGDGFWQVNGLVLCLIEPIRSEYDVQVKLQAVNHTLCPTARGHCN